MPRVNPISAHNVGRHLPASCELQYRTICLLTWIAFNRHPSVITSVKWNRIFGPQQTTMITGGGTGVAHPCSSCHHFSIDIIGQRLEDPETAQYISPRRAWGCFIMNSFILISYRVNNIESIVCTDWLLSSLLQCSKLHLQYV